MSTLTERLAESLVAVSPDCLDGRVIETAKLFVLDWLANALAGTGTHAGKILLADARERGSGKCAVLGLEERHDSEVAALTNGALSHIVEMDDIDRGSVVHPGCVVIPAALAAAQETDAAGLRFLAAVVLGYEAAVRIGEAVGRSHYEFWQNTATCGGFGAAAAASFIYDLDVEKMCWAFGNAGSISSGLWQFNREGAMTKHLHAGRAAANGLLAARLAQRGFTGAREILEGRQGFFAAMCRDAEPSRVVRGLSTVPAGEKFPWKIAGVSIKPHASCRHTHPAIDAALSIRSELGEDKAEEVKVIEVMTYKTALNITDAPDPRNSYQAKFSLQYCTAHALLYGSVGLNDFGDQRLGDERLRRLMSKVKLEVDPDIDAAFPKSWGARVTVQHVNGKTWEKTCLAAKGDPENPVTAADLSRKLAELARGTAFEGQTESILKRIRELHERPSMRGFLENPEKL